MPIAVDDPTNNPAPMIPPKVIIETWRDFSVRPSSLASEKPAPSIGPGNKIGILSDLQCKTFGTLYVALSNANRENLTRSPLEAAGDAATARRV